MENIWKLDRAKGEFHQTAKWQKQNAQFKLVFREKPLNSRIGTRILWIMVQKWRKRTIGAERRANGEQTGEQLATHWRGNVNK